jgi:hypothetical protein
MAKRRRHFSVKPQNDRASTRRERSVPREDDPRPGARFYRAEYLSARQILDKHGGVSLGSVLEVAAGAQVWLTGQVANVWHRTQAPRVACKEGCTWCCFLAVSAWPMELLVLAAWLEEHRTRDELAVLLRQLRAAVAEGDRQRAAAPNRARRLMCPLLAGGQCSVYAVRPAACVGWNSADVEPCRAFAEGDEEANCTVEPLRFFSARAVPEAAAAALADCGGPAFDLDGNGEGAAVDLSAGLLAVLELGAKKAAQSWLNGSPFLAEARKRMERPPPYVVSGGEGSGG